MGSQALAYALQRQTRGTFVVRGGEKNYTEHSILARCNVRSEFLVLTDEHALVVERSPWTMKTEFLINLPLERGRVELSWPLKIETALSGDYFITSNDDLDVRSYGNTPEESRQNFCEIFEEMLDLYNNSKDEDLSGDAIRLKALFDKIIKS